MRTNIISFVIILFIANFIFAQPGTEKQLKDFTAQDELVTLSATIPFSTAVTLLSKIHELKTHKKIISMVDILDPIGVEIKNVQYEKALLMIVNSLNLVYEQTEEGYIIKRKDLPKIEKTAGTYAPVDAREVRIYATFFEMDVQELKDKGINWQYILSHKDGSVNINQVSTTQGQSTSTTTSGGQNPFDFSLTGSSAFQMGNFTGKVTSFFKFLESQNLGEVISSPSITVRDRNEGKIQVGSNISIKQRDFSGNVTDKFFETGSIVTVTPYIYNEQGIDYILLSLEVERSTGFPSEISTEIKKTMAKTQVIMLNGEETVIGGLFLNEEKISRVGIPFLKDLPWWVFGIKYIAGSDQIQITKKELAILIRVELLPTLKERFASPIKDKVLKSELEIQKEKLKSIQSEIK